MKKLGILRETKNQWEARVPLNPEAVKTLVDDGYQVTVQPSDLRIYKNNQYASVGATISDDLSDCDLIIGVKEIKIPDMVPGKPHMFFSHTIKGQDYNMPMLREFMDNKCSILDYERIVDEDNRRLVFFGKFAGNAGMIDTLWATGKRLEEHLGLATPLSKVKRAFEYERVNDAVDHLRELSEEIKKNGLPKELGPFVIFLLGYGHVATGCKEILAGLPIEEIDPNDLGKLDKDYKNDRIYLAVFKEHHLVERKDDRTFDLMDYFKHGPEYQSRMKRYLPYCSIYVNAIYWAPGYPVFLTKKDIADIQNGDRKMLSVGDITCDIEGSVEATVKATYPDNPVYTYDGLKDEIIDGYMGEGVTICAVDNLPCEFSMEASDGFTKALLPFMKAMLDNDWSKSIEESDLPYPIKKSIIIHQGKLEPEYAYIQEFLN